MIREIYIFGPDRFGTDVSLEYVLKRDDIARSNIPSLVREIAKTLHNSELEIEFHSLPLPRQMLYYSYRDNHSIFLLADRNIRESEAKEKMGELKSTLRRFLKGGNPWRDSFDEAIRNIIKTTLKAILIGESAVGKTTCWRLLSGEPLPVRHIATLRAKQKKIDLKVDDEIILWDIPGQVGFEKDWPRLVRGSNIIVVVFDSMIENIEKARWVIKSSKEWEPDAKVIVIANKQDRTGAMPANYIEKHLRTPTWGLEAINPRHRARLENILEEAVRSEEL